MPKYEFLFGIGVALQVTALIAREAHPLAEPRETLRGRTLVRDAGFPIPSRLVVVGNYLVTANAQPNSPIQIRRREDGRLVKELGTWGNGPFEFMSASHLDRAGETTVWAYDITRHRLALIDVNESRRERSEVRRWLTIRSDAGLTAPTWLGDSLISPGYFARGRFAVFGPEGKFARFVGAAPHRGNEPPLITAQAYRARLAVDPSRSRVVLATPLATHVELYDGTLRLVARAEVPETFEPQYDIVYSRGEPRLVFDSLSRYGYLDVAAGKDYVVALFSGRQSRDVKSYPDGKVLHVFDWKGKLIRTLELPLFATAVALDDEEHKLYVAHTRPVPALAAYELPPMRRTE